MESKIIVLFEVRKISMTQKLLNYIHFDDFLIIIFQIIITEWDQYAPSSYFVKLL